MKEWKEVRFGDVVLFNPIERVKKGTTVKKVSMDKLQPFTRNVSGFDLVQYNGGAKFRNGDTLMARITPCLENGKTALISILDDDEVGVGSTEFIVLRNIKDITNSRFVYYFTITPWFRDIAIKSMVGSSGRQRVQQSVIENLDINLPPLLTQRRIARILGALDDKIELNRRMNDNLEQQARATFKSWFVDFEPFRSGDFVNSELGMIPKGWKVGTLGDIAEIVMGQSPAGHSYNESGDGCIFYQGRTEFGARYPKIRLFTSEPKRLANIGDILLSVRAPVGDINVATVKCCIGRGLASLHSKDGNDSLLLYSMLNLKSKLEMFNDEGTVFGCVTKNDLYNMPIVIPEKNVIQDFEVISSSLDNYIKYNFDQSQVLSSLRDTLLPKLMSGELPVDEVEKNI